LPFSSFEFFILMALFIVVMAALKPFAKHSAYKYVLAVLNAIFLLLFFPQPWHFFALIVWSYFGIWLFSDVLKLTKKIWGILFLLLPMLLMKFDIKVDFYPFTLNNILSFAGLSYASFRIVGYYMDKSPDERITEPVSWFNFLSFTPTLLIGPIDRFHRFRTSQDNGFSQITTDNFLAGWSSLVKGLAFKYVLAELVDRYWLNSFPADDHAFFHAANTMYAYYFYLFFDFAGYSFMALGIGKMMGMEVPVNFTNPFIAVNPQDFWRRFHISLGDWLKDYFFTPLYLFLTRRKSLKKYPVARQNTALLLTFVLMGCWNGFYANFVLSGLLFGIYSLVYNTYSVQCKKKGRDVVFGTLNPKWVKVISVVVVFHLVAFALYVFSGRAPF
jgi:membrane protein involved in D-alanine export